MRQDTLIGTWSTNQELFRDILRTIPAKIYHAEISFLAEGVSRDWGKDFDENKYIKDCKSKGIMPFSMMELSYDSSNKVLNSKTQFGRSLLNVDEKSSETRKRACLDGFLNGGKVHRLKFEAKGLYHYLTFQACDFEKLLNSGYHVDETDLWVDTYHLTGYNEGTYREGGIKFGKGFFTHGVEIDCPKLVDWFTELAKKHNAPIVRAKEMQEK